ncbi:MAG: hypothetical protein [Podoviridae sp. ctbd591]|nr:MAG: hypothetical protein [Podoviridae sp. ctbd591]
MKTGFTNKLCVLLAFLLVLDTILSFIMGIYSIRKEYMGALPFFTVCVTPVNAGIALVLNSGVNKSKAENTGANGEGINYAKFIESISEGVDI